MRGEWVTVLTPVTVSDPYGDEPVEDWTQDPTERAVYTLAPCEPRPSEEPVQDARNALVSGFTVYLPYADPITVKDRVRVRGEDYPVQGFPAVWGARGVVVQVYREEG